jgi:DNA-binding transcriptional ArsR family regulator
LKGICRRRYVHGVSADVFTVVADPTRRRILHELIDRERSVGELVGSLGLTQPAVSKHLKVLREHGFVASRTAAQQRIYRLDQPPFAELEAWLGPFRQKWNRHVDALERHLDQVALDDDQDDRDDLERNDD